MQRLQSTVWHVGSFSSKAGAMIIRFASFVMQRGTKVLITK
jgi:hypothetical protein